MQLEGARILLVDDEEALAENLIEILEDEGASVERAATAAAGLEAATAGRFDIALVDVRLPDANGIEMLPKLQDRDDSIEVLLITGNASLEDAINAVRTGAYAYVLKPFDPDNLIQSAVRAVAKVRLRREADALSAELASRENQLRTLVDTVQALLLVLDENGTVVLVNPAVAAATGVAQEDMVGTDWVGEFIPEHQRDMVRESIRALVQGEPHNGHEHNIVRREPNGELSERKVRWRSAALHGKSGDVRVYASGLDVTELDALQHRARLAEKLAAVGTLAAGLAHEIRNPLNAASLQLQMLERRAKKLDESDRLTGPVETVQSEIQRLSRLVEDFLRFARPADVHPVEVDVCRVLRDVVALEQPAAQGRGVALSFAATDEPVVVGGDPEKIKQVALNLVRNALEAVDDETGRVEMRVGHEGAGCKFSVRDNGPGIPAENLTRIFEPFFSTKDAGTGLGMAICHSLVELHGGDLSVETDGGAVFTVRLPRRPPTRTRSAARAG